MTATRRRFVAAGMLALACPALMAAFSRWRGVLFPAYRTASRALMALLATVTGVVPCAIWDIALLVGGVAVLVAVVRDVRARRWPWAPLSVACLVVSINLFLFVAGWALNHYAPPLAGELGIEVRASSADELAEVTEAYLEEAARRAPLVPRNDDGSLARQDFLELAAVCGSSYEALAGECELFRGPTLPVKALLVWGEPLLYSGHTGIFWAPTGEAGVPLDSAVADEPYIMCHEAAHRLGIASEQEANFAAFLACAASDDVRLAYSGYYNAFAYCHNALYRVDPERAKKLLEEHAQGELGMGVALVWADRIATAEHYDRFEGPFERVGTTVNDRYLRSFGEQEGVRSYGLVVDYLIAWHRRGE